MPPTLRDIAKLSMNELPHAVGVERLNGAFEVTIRPPGSKSLTNRVLLLAALAEGTSTLTGALVEADDAQVMISALRQLGAVIEITPEVDERGELCGNATLRVTGVGGRWKIKPGERVTLNLNNAGTATRFLTAAALLQPPDAGGIVIDGNARMRQRPIGELVDAIHNLTERGTRIEYLGAEGYPPIHVPSISVEWISAMRQVFVPTQSSQFISALLLLAPFLPSGLEAEFHGQPTSPAYIHMTLGVLRQLGVAVTGGPPGEVRVSATPLKGFTLAIEPDASGATYPLAAAALLPGSSVTVPGLSTRSGQSLQGDSHFASVLQLAGAEIAGHRANAITCRGGPRVLPFEADLTDMPDTAMTAAVVACFADGASTLRGLRTLRVKETDRIAALVTELAKVGVKVEPFSYTNAADSSDEGIRITPPVGAGRGGPGGIDCSPSVPVVEFDTYDDHRMAMSLALIGLRRPNVVIRDPACVRKTYPTFWRDLAKLYQTQP